MLQFKDKKIDKKFIMNGKSDQRIVIPASPKHGPFQGLLSDVTDAAIIDGMIARNSTKVAHRPPPTKPEGDQDTGTRRKKRDNGTEPNK